MREDGKSMISEIPSGCAACGAPPVVEIEQRLREQRELLRKVLLLPSLTRCYNDVATQELLRQIRATLGADDQPVAPVPVEAETRVVFPWESSEES